MNKRHRAIGTAMGARRLPKRLPSKHAGTMFWDDWPHAGPAPGRPSKVFFDIGHKREAAEAWRIESLNHVPDDGCPDDEWWESCPWCLSMDCLAMCDEGELFRYREPLRVPFPEALK